VAGSSESIPGCAADFRRETRHLNSDMCTQIRIDSHMRTCFGKNVLAESGVGRSNRSGERTSKPSGTRQNKAERTKTNQNKPVVRSGDCLFPTKWRGMWVLETLVHVDVAAAETAALRRRARSTAAPGCHGGPRTGKVREPAGWTPALRRAGTILRLRGGGGMGEGGRSTHGL
jgi:hypothetical protein